VSSTDHPITAARPRRSLVGLAVIAGVLGLTVVVGLGPVATPAYAEAAILKTLAPAVPTGLPSGIEDLAGYVAQVSCDPQPKAGTLKLAHLLTSTYPGTSYLTSHPCGSDGIPSEHEDGRAVAWLVSVKVSTQKAAAQSLLNWLFASDAQQRPMAMARRMGIAYIIWNNQIWGAYDPFGGWKPYSTCAQHPEATADQVCHRDRMQISLSWAGATGQTSYWSRTVAGPDYGPCRDDLLNWAPPYTGRNPTKCPVYPAVRVPDRASSTYAALIKYSGAEVGPDDVGPVVSAVQTALGVTADGSYGRITADAVAAFQTKSGLAPSGVMTGPTWFKLLAVVAARTPVQPTQPTQPTKPVPTNPLTKYLNTVLHYGDKGAAVVALQKRLGVLATGTFGIKTRAAVVKFQLAKKLTANGTVDRLTWKALGA
jgi:peptidoglycan hydrolase-like protein with peptidoglycan-binding domain